MHACSLAYLRYRTCNSSKLRLCFAETLPSSSMAGPNKARRWSELSLLDLPEALLISIVKQHLPLKSKIHLQAVSREFRDILRKPHGGSAIWDIIELDDPVFERAHPTALARQTPTPCTEHLAY